jgi:hypothetical protein
MAVFGLFRPKQADVLDHWYTLVSSFHTSTQEFYASVEQELKDRKVPGLDISRVEFAEGGPLSAKRLYLRMTRERLVFDICAAPFGTAYFFSCRFAELPSRVKFWELAVFLILLWVIVGIVFGLLGRYLGGFPTLVVSIVVLSYVIWLLRNAVSMGLTNLDATLLKFPVIGPVYERFLRKETYYREDTRLMYIDTVSNVVKQEVEEVTAAKGIKLLRYHERSPILGELYKPREVRLDVREPPRAAM